MPSPYLTKLSNELDIPTEELESKWSEAKKATSETFGVAEGDFAEREYAYATGIVKNMLGITESYIKQFLASELPAKDFAKAVVEGTLKEESVDIKAEPEPEVVVEEPAEPEPTPEVVVEEPEEEVPEEEESEVIPEPDEADPDEFIIDLDDDEELDEELTKKETDLLDKMMDEALDEPGKK